ncbi:PREDICTED: protein IQ-DOMAIN 14 isoform X2 [Tarenaya hassleriana]|uniref:protein IQ-DOMAIN 14 isoform X2 n=1 Tax=Tarenaya hassleriana TaxID=28532 RepID=UPI00053C9241|nr:PREDICTED: protein IQ-DOMAIN 14 isoform X2 [Tarenaya hassleriana]
MGKKGSWFSAIKRVFTPHHKEKLGNEAERKSTKDKKKKGFGKLRHGETNSFLPIFREPSSIEKILGEAEREHSLVFKPPSPASVPPPVRPSSPRVPSQRFVSPPIVPSPRPTSPRIASPPHAASPRDDPPRSVPPRHPSPKPPSPRAASPRVVQRREYVYRPEPTPAVLNASAIKIQSAFRGYMARRSFRALKGLVRLQGVVRGHSVKRQTMNAMKYMQLLVRVQTQIQSRRIQMLENQARRQARNEIDDARLAASISEAGNEDWDDSVLTKEEKEARMQRKIDAIFKRERSMAYAYSHQLWKNSPKSAQPGLAGVRSGGGFPLWWNWVDRQLPLGTPSPSLSQTLKDFRFTPTRPSPQPQSSGQNHFNFDTPTPKSSESTAFTPSRPIRTPQPSRYSRGGRALDYTFKDDDSLTSCPPFSVPSYMAPTVSAKAKVRPSSNPKERVAGTPGSNEKRRLSFPLAQGLGSFKWNKGSLFMSSNNNNGGKVSSSGVVVEKHKTLQSIGNTSVDSTVSMPAAVGRKPFNRFA